MQVEILGSFRASCSGRSVVPTATKPRSVLALLALHANDVVAVPQLAEELWSEDVPRSGKAILQTYVLYVRKLIGAALGSTLEATRDVLATVPGGYSLLLGDGDIDVRQFEQLADAGHRMYEVGDYAGSSDTFGEALSLWRADPLADVPLGRHLSGHVKQLAEARLNVLDRRIDADLRLGRHHALLAELATLAERYPTHEGLCRHLMLALYHSGRRLEALNSYESLHERLSGTFGIRPSAELRRLHEAILREGDSAAELVHGNRPVPVDTPSPVVS